MNMNSQSFKIYREWLEFFDSGLISAKMFTKLRHSDEASQSWENSPTSQSVNGRNITCHLCFLIGLNYFRLLLHRTKYYSTGNAEQTVYPTQCH